MAYRTFLKFAATLVVTFFTFTVNAQNFVCGPKNPSDHLKQKYQETLKIRAITSEGFLMSIYASENGTYTIVFVPPDSNDFCLGGSGTEFLMYVKKKIRN